MRLRFLVYQRMKDSLLRKLEYVWGCHVQLALSRLPFLGEPCAVQLVGAMKGDLYEPQHMEGTFKSSAQLLTTDGAQFLASSRSVGDRSR